MLGVHLVGVALRPAPCVGVLYSCSLCCVCVRRTGVWSVPADGPWRREMWAAELNGIEGSHVGGAACNSIVFRPSCLEPFRFLLSRQVQTSLRLVSNCQYPVRVL